jgi:endonuclease/exonuclease/phosphatase family metal-dependent hydrolase
VLFNVHLSAYGSDESIRTAQIKKLTTDMQKEYEKGNYCVCAGDFNHDFTGDSTLKLNGGESVDFGWAQPFPTELLPKGIKRCDNYTDAQPVPTCRNCDVPYKEGNFTIIVDGFLVSENVEVKTLKNIDTGFEYSDHNPTYMEFAFK